MSKLTAFVAHSFSPEDEGKVQPILNFMNSLRDVGFFWQTAERAEVESVSKKVRRIIDESDVFVGILTRRHAVYRVASLTSAWEVFRGRLRPAVWTPPPWILQEMGYALKGGKDLIIFREPEVESGGLQGDLEYIEYVWTSAANAFQRANEMLTKLIAKRTGIVVETVVRVAPAAEMEPAAPAVASQTEEPAPKQPTLAECYSQLIIAFEAKDYSKVGEAYERGAALAKEEGPEAVLHWKAYYLSHEFRTGNAGALEQLKSLQGENPQDALVPALVGRSLETFNENESAAVYFSRAASLASGERSANFAILSAECMKKAKKHGEARALLLQTLSQAPHESRTVVLRKLYDVLADEGSSYYAFGVAELSLRENPGQMDFRFSLGLQYHRTLLHDLFLHQYKVTCEHEPENAAALHNLALACSECGLPILSVSHYKQALGLGETLSASNLGYKYLDWGMADEATEVLQRASGVVGCVAEVTGCLAEVTKRREKEVQAERSKIEATVKHRDFLIALGEGFLFAGTAALEGVWKFPFGDMALRILNGKLTGELDKTTETPASPLLGLGGGSRGPYKRVEKFRFSGVLAGRTCKFEMRSETLGEGISVFLLSSMPTTTEGYIVFAPDGRSGELAELKEGKPDTYYRISR